MSSPARADDAADPFVVSSRRGSSSPRTSIMSNPFETLGLDPSFALDSAVLEQRQRELNRAMHPDRHAGKGAGERRQALSRSMDVNQAYRTLRDPASRAEALFEMLGIPELAERTIADPALLGEMLEQRELLDEARRDKARERLYALKVHMLERQARVEEALGRAFEPLLVYARSGDPRTTRGSEVDAAHRLFSELKYVRRFGEEVAAIEDEI
jgi:molecular chaperone HscB